MATAAKAPGRTGWCWAIRKGRAPRAVSGEEQAAGGEADCKFQCSRGAPPRCDVSPVQQPRGSWEGKPSGCPRCLPGLESSGQTPLGAQVFLCHDLHLQTQRDSPHLSPSPFFTPPSRLAEGVPVLAAPQSFLALLHLCPPVPGAPCNPRTQLPPSLKTCPPLSPPALCLGAHYSPHGRRLALSDSCACAGLPRQTASRKATDHPCPSDRLYGS